MSPRPLLRRALVASVSLLAGIAVVPVLASPASAAATATNPVETVGADALPTWQINGVVWSQAIVGNTVYAVGSFTKARPGGTAAGDPAEVPAANIFAYDLTTGERVTTFDHALNAQALVVKASPDGARIYVGGDFTTVDGIARPHVAAFNTADGSLVTTWAPNVGGQVRALAPTATSIYVGGNFPSAGGELRSSLAAFNVQNSRLQTWAPTVEGSGGYVWSMVMAPAGDEVVIGGSFASINGIANPGMGAVGLAGETLPWAANQRLKTFGLNGAITSLDTDGVSVFGSGYAYTDPVNAQFEGTFSANPSGGTVNWVNDCLGDTYDTANMAGALYFVSHSHDCSAIGEFPDTNPRTRWQKAGAVPITGSGRTITNTDAYGWDFRGLQAGGLLQWYPDLDFGSYTADRQAAWSAEASSGYLVLGGEFPTVNGKAQQGLVRFAVPGVGGARTSKPIVTTGFTPVASNVDGDRMRVRWAAAWDRDDKTLTYDVYRNGGPSVARFTADSTWWNLPALTFTDTVTPGQSYSYQVRATDSDGNVQWSGKSAAVIAATVTDSAYTTLVKGDGATHLWSFADPTGTTLTDRVGGLDGTTTAVTFGQPGIGVGGTAASTTSSAKVLIPNAEPHPGAVSVEAWFKTNSTSGGRILGFGNQASSASNMPYNDLVLYLGNNGKVNFTENAGGGTGGTYRTVTSARAYNDNAWHHVVATAGPDGTLLYLDGRRVVRDQTAPKVGTFTGFWRLFSDQTTNLPNKPTNGALPGTVEEVAVYPGVLSQAQVQSHYLASGRAAQWSTSVPTGSYAAAVMADQPDEYWRLAEPNGAVATDASRGGVDGTISGAGTYNVAGAVPGNGALTLTEKNGYVASKDEWLAPQAWSTEVWFRSTSTRGGKLMGFGNAATGTSTNYDRHVVLLSNGHLQAGVYSGGQVPIETTRSYNDGAWHHVVLTQGAGGLVLYVDAQPVASSPVTTAQAYLGFWRVGGDVTWGGTASTYPAATVDEFAVYPRALDLTAVRAHYTAAGFTAPNLAPTASFTSSASFENLSVDGSASSDPDGTVASYAWTFGDGATGSGPTASHTYAASGTYQVSLTVTDNRGATAATTRSVTVTANQAPVASFTSSTDALGLTVDGSASSDPDGTVASYAWSFGDGTTGSGSSASHTYASAGSYTVTLTVSDAQGLTGSASRTVDVTSVANQPPAAHATVTTDGLVATADGSASSDPDGTVASYSWSFGDGGTASGPSATHTYAVGGTYTVTLTVTDDRGATSSTSTTVLANAAPSASFTHAESWLTTTVDGRGSSDPDGSVASYAWAFGDGATGSGATASHTYAAAGSYAVSLTVTDDHGATATTTSTVTVTADPAVARDAFERTAAASWGPADLGGAWTVSGTASRWAVGNGTGSFTATAAGTGGTASLNAMPSATDLETDVVVSSDQAATGGGQYVSVLGRVVSAGNDYRAKLRLGADGVVTTYLSRVVANAETVLTSGAVPGLTYSAGDRLSVRFQVSGQSPTTLRVKIWKAGTSEPTAWLLTTTDVTASLQSGGTAGLYFYVSGTATNLPTTFRADDVWSGPLR